MPHVHQPKRLQVSHTQPLKQLRAQIGLSMVIPNGQSIIADSYPETARGKAFGALYLTGAFGAMFGTLYATNMGTPASTPAMLQPPSRASGWQAGSCLHSTL